MTSRTHEPPSYPRVDAVLEVIANWIKRYRYAVGLRGELARCGPEEVARTARDIGVSPRELVRLAAKGPHAADQLPKLLLALGVDPQQLRRDDPAMMWDLQRLCITCGHKGRCEHELAAGTAAGHYREFCPNAVSLEDLLANDAKGGSHDAASLEGRV